MLFCLKQETSGIKHHTTTTICDFMSQTSLKSSRRPRSSYSTRRDVSTLISDKHTKALHNKNPGVPTGMHKASRSRRLSSSTTLNVVYMLKSACTCCTRALHNKNPGVPTVMHRASRSRRLSSATTLNVEYMLKSACTCCCCQRPSSEVIWMRVQSHPTTCFAHLGEEQSRSILQRL